jgi:hypothetical protein
MYATLPVRGAPSAGLLVSAAARPQLPQALALARAMRPLRRRVQSATRRVLDEEATADLRAEQRLWLPALIPDSEPAFDLALVLDDSESMALWSEKVREFRLLCERVGAFRDVRLWRLGASGDDGEGEPVLRGLSRSSGTRDLRELIDPSGRRLILVITDGVHPWWRPSGPLRPVLARWALASPLAIVQPFPQRLWERGPLRPVTAEFRPGWPGSGPTIFRAGDGHDGGQGSLGSVAVPILELSPAAMSRWAGIISGTSGLTPLPAAALPRKGGGGEEQHGVVRNNDGGSSVRPDPVRLVREFRAAVSPAAYQLAGYLSAAPLTLPVMRLVQESMMPETGPAELAEVFLSGLLLKTADTDPRADPEGTSYVFAAGVRDALQTTLTRAEALGVLDRVGGYLISGRRGGRPFPVLLRDQPHGGDIAAAAERFPDSFGRISGTLLERIGGPPAQDAARELARPDEEAVLTAPGELEEPAEPEEAAEPAEPARATHREGERHARIFDQSALASGKLYQPMLFVGLGGTGCDIGAELERRLRDAICGPDGNDFCRRSGNDSLLPYQLPSCVQFVYADLNQSELRRMPSRVVPGPEHLSAARFTAGYVQGPAEDSYPDLARRVRLAAGTAVDGWLPPASPDEPRVNPLHRGAGQLPTVARAALFGTLLDGRGAAIQAIGAAVGRLSGSAGDLFALGGRLPRALDVFVAFSVAGGTGAGTFYDYLHIIADIARRQSGLRVRIYPLVLMPSAFREGLGGGRAARLNAGGALLDLFRLSDTQDDAEAANEAVTYPDRTRIVMAPGTLATGLMFSQPAGATREDMQRSVASLVLSLVGTEPSADDSPADEHYQSFADSFLGQPSRRLAPAGNRVGRRGVSTALAASLSVPAGEIAGLIAARLLSTAISQIAVPGPFEANRPGMEEFMTKAGVFPIATRPEVPFKDPGPGQGARDIAEALSARQDAMNTAIASLEARLDQDVSALAARFDPSGAARELLNGVDVFRLARIVFGHQGLRDATEQGGVSGLLQRRRAAPAAPPAIDADPPPMPELRDRFARRVRWSDEQAVATRARQNAWYQWRTHLLWATAWDAHARQWQRPLEQLQRDVSALTRVLNEFATGTPGDFERRSADLYRKRAGVSYLFPPGSGWMERFYQHVARLMMGQLARDGLIGVNSSAADLVTGLVGAGIWAEVFRVSAGESPERAVEFLRERVRAEIARFLVASAPGEPPPLPRLRQMLADFAEQSVSRNRGLPEDQLSDFAGTLAGLVPANFTPQGSGPLKVLVTYPADAPSASIERYLARSLNLPSGPGITHEFRATSADAITVVLVRTTIGVTDVDEVRDLLGLWASAEADPRPTDLLRWRQRTGYDVGDLATRERDRVEDLPETTPGDVPERTGRRSRRRLDPVGPFGNPDASRADIEDLISEFVDFGGNPAYGHLATRANDSMVRVIVGKLGAGKTVYLRRFQDFQAHRVSVYAAAPEQSLPNTEVIVKASQWFSDRVLVEKWMQIWERAIMRSLASHLLRRPELRRQLSDEQAQEMEHSYARLLGDFRRPRSIYSAVRDIVNQQQTADRLSAYLDDPLWDDLEDLLGEAVSHCKPIYFYLDAVAEEFSHAPMYWLKCQEGLFYQVMRLLRDAKLGGRLHVVVCVSDMVMSSVYRSEHAPRYYNEPHIRVLTWDRGSLLYLLGQKLRRLPPSVLMRRATAGVPTIRDWLGINDDWVAPDGDGTLEDYLLSHTRMIPRDIISLGNELSEEVLRQKQAGQDGLPAAALQRVVQRCAKRSGDAQLAQCANQISSDLMPANGALQDYSELFTSTQAYIGGVVEEIRSFVRMMGVDRFPAADLAALREVADQHFESSTDLAAVLWQNGLLGYVDGSGRRRFYSMGDIDQFHFPPAADAYVLHPCLVYAVGGIRHVREDSEQAPGAHGARPAEAAQQGSWSNRLLDDAERIAYSITVESSKAWALRGVAEALAATDPDRAERIAASISVRSSRASALSEVAKALAAADPERAARLFTNAERIATSITGDSSRASALSEVAKALAAADPERAARLFTDAERIATSITEESLAASALSEVVKAMAATDPDRALRIAASITDESWRAWALRGAAEAMAGTDPGRAEIIAASITRESSRVSALSEVAKALAAGDPERAARLFTDAERITTSITDESSKASALRGLARALAATDPDRAERIAAAITVGSSRASALSEVAKALAADDPGRAARLFTDAKRIATAITDESSKASALSEIARALAAAATWLP